MKKRLNDKEIIEYLNDRYHYHTDFDLYRIYDELSIKIIYKEFFTQYEELDQKHFDQEVIKISKDEKIVYLRLAFTNEIDNEEKNSLIMTQYLYHIFHMSNTGKDSLTLGEFTESNTDSIRFSMSFLMPESFVFNQQFDPDKIKDLVNIDKNLILRRVRSLHMKVFAS